jgi:2-haloalkanoic acid dehalogenase type II
LASSNSALLPCPSAIAFDCYRTLFQNAPADWERTFGEICLEQRLTVSGPDLWDRWKTYEVNFRATRLSPGPDGALPPFRSYRQAWGECFARVFKDLGARADPRAAAAACVRHMAARQPYPETAAAVAALAERTKVAVLSNADDDFLRPCLSALKSDFAAVVSSESARVYKPAPGIFLALLDRLDLEPRTVWFVGDHLHEDVYGSAAAGMSAIWINRPARDGYYAGQVGLTAGRQQAPHAEISGLLELLGLLDVASGARANTGSHSDAEVR